MRAAELLEAIAQAAREKATSLDLSGKRIKTIPQLIECYISREQIGV
jgi:hypothetical protein